MKPFLCLFALLLAACVGCGSSEPPVKQGAAPAPKVEDSSNGKPPAKGPRIPSKR